MAAKLFIIGLFCVLLFNSALSYTPEEARALTIAKFGVPPEDLTLEIIQRVIPNFSPNATRSSNKRAATTCSPTVRTCDDGNYCTGVDFCPEDTSIPTCVGINAFPNDKRNKGCVYGGSDDCQVGTCTPNSPGSTTDTSATCTYVSTTTCDFVGTDCTGPQSCRPATSSQGAGCNAGANTNEGNNCAGTTTNQCLQSQGKCSSGSCVHAPNPGISCNSGFSSTGSGNACYDSNGVCQSDGTCLRNTLPNNTPCTGPNTGTPSFCLSTTDGTCIAGSCTYSVPVHPGEQCDTSAAYPYSACEVSGKGTCSSGTCNPGGVYKANTETCTADFSATPSGECYDANNGHCSGNSANCIHDALSTGTCTTPTGTPSDCLSTDSGTCSNGVCIADSTNDNGECDTDAFHTYLACEVPSKGICSSGTCNPGGVYKANTETCNADFSATPSGECYDANNGHCSGTSGDCVHDALSTGTCTTPSGTIPACSRTDIGTCSSGSCVYGVPDSSQDSSPCDTTAAHPYTACEVSGKGTCSSGTCNPGGVYKANTETCTADFSATPSGECYDANNGHCSGTSGDCVHDALNTGTCTTPTGTPSDCLSTDSGTCSNGVCIADSTNDNGECDTDASHTYLACEVPSKGICSSGTCNPGGVYKANTETCNADFSATPSGECYDTNNGHCSGTSGDCVHDALSTGTCTTPSGTIPACSRTDIGTCSSGSCVYGVPDSSQDSSPCDTSAAHLYSQCEISGKGTCSSGTCNPGGVYKAATESCTNPTDGTPLDCHSRTTGKCNPSNGACSFSDFITCATASGTECKDEIKCLAGACVGGTIHTDKLCDKISYPTGSCSYKVCSSAGQCDVSKSFTGCDAGSACVGAETCDFTTPVNDADVDDGVCQAGVNAATSFNCYNGQVRPLNNRCEPSGTGTVKYDAARCNNQPCVPDDSLNPIRTGEGFCDCWSGWKGDQCEGYATTGASDNPNTGGVGKDAFDGTNLPPAVDAKKGDFSPTVKLTLGNTVTVTVTVPSSQNMWNKPAGTSSYSLSTLLKFEKPVQNPNGVAPSSKRIAFPAIEDSVAIHNELGTINTVIPSEQKRAVTNNPSCNYPNDFNWEIATTNTNGQWVDTYTNTLTYTQMAACGLTYAGSDDNYAFFNGTIKIERDFFLGNDRFHFDRTYSVEQDYAIQFPRNLKATTKVLVSNNTVEFWAAVTKINFDPVVQKWKITIGTAINKPYYKLQLVSYPAMDASTPGPFATGVIRDWTYLPAEQSDGADCSIYTGGDCSQEFVFETHSCDPIDITAMTLGFKAVCRQNGTPDVPGECAYPNLLQETPSATIDLHTGSTCPVHKDFAITNIDLFTYSDNTYATAKTLFGISEQMYLGVNFDEPPALLKHVEVVSVCAYPRSQTNGVVPSECPANRIVDSAAVTTSAPLAAGDPFPSPHKITLHVLAGLVKAKAQVASDGVNELDVQVDIKLTYKGTLNPSSKRAFQTYSRSFTVTAPVSIQGSGEKAEEIAYDKSSASATTYGLLVLVLVIAALF